MRRKGPRRDAQKERFWREAIQQQQRSGQSISKYCCEKGLREPSFYAWRRELKRRRSQRAKKPLRRAADQRPAFVSVQLAPGITPLGSATIECLLPGGIVLRLPASMEPAAIAAVLRSWEQSPC
jgi:hypothetical protein